MSEARLLPPNASRLETALEQSLAAGLQALRPEAILDQWNADTCPVGNLAWLAWALSVDEWDDAWSEQVKRDVIRASVEVHRQKGTLYAVRTALEPLRVSAEITEWWQQEPPGVPATFAVTAWANDNLIGGDTVLTPALEALMRRQIAAAKPERAHYDLVMAARHDATLGVACAARNVTVRRDAAEVAPVNPPAQDVTARLACAARHVTVCRVAMEIA